MIIKISLKLTTVRRTNEWNKQEPFEVALKPIKRLIVKNKNLFKNLVYSISIAIAVQQSSFTSEDWTTDSIDGRQDFGLNLNKTKCDDSC